MDRSFLAFSFMFVWHGVRGAALLVFVKTEEPPPPL